MKKIKQTNHLLFFRSLNKCLLISFLLLISGGSFGQKGNSYISNYPFLQETGMLKTQDLLQDESGVLILATSKGLATFDGSRWDLIKTNNHPMQLCPKNGKIYVATTKGFGFAEKDNTGKYEYIPLSDSLSQKQNFWEIKTINNNLFFCGTEKIIKYSTTENTVVNDWSANEEEPFLGTINDDKLVYVNIYKLGFHAITPKGLKSIRTPDELVESEIVFSLKKDSITIFGMDNNTVWSFKKGDFAKLDLECNDYLTKGNISGGIMTSKGLLAISTLTGGTAVVELNTGKTIHIINYQTGLPDDEVFAMTTDQNGGLWLAHEFGLSRANLHLPIKDFSSYPGLEGNLLSVLIDNNDLYVATSEGVYYLDDVKNYKEIEILVKKQVEKSTAIETNYVSPILTTESKQANPEKSVELSRREQRKNRRKNRRKNKNKGENKPSTKKDSIPKTVIEAQNKNNINFFETSEPKQADRQKIYALQSIKYLFKPIKGIEDKCKELLKVGNYILVGGNKGLYAINNYRAKIIVEDKYLNKLYKSKYNNRVYVGASDGFFSVIETHGKWKIEEYFDDFEQNIISIVERDNRNLWLGSENVAYKVRIDQGAHPLSIKPYYFSNETTEEIYVREIYGKPFFFLRSGIYGYNSDTDSIYYNEEVNQRFFNRYRYIFSQNTITWILSNNEWVNINHEPELLSLKSFYLNLFNEIQNIFVDTEQNLWVIDGNNKLFFVEATSIPSVEKQFDVFFTQVRNTSGLNFSFSALNLDYKNSSLTFRVAAPYFVKAEGTTYQYKIDGLMTDWSEWSSSANISFPFIPEGKYKIQVRAKNVFGLESEIKELEFVIQPPFWRTKWFYLLGVVFAAAIIVLVVKLRERKLKNEQHILEERVKRRTEQLNKEKQKSDDLLLNILPHETAEELKTKGKATARYYNLTTVLFTDFKGFTKISESITPVELVKELDECFIAFDQIIEDYNIEKIKTIGDAYMCVGGVPARNQSNPIESVLAGLAITDFMEKMKQNRIAEKKPFWELRLGIHTGPLIAGVVGKNKFAYDVWGDTVNTASRMESSGEPGKVNISAATYEFIKKYFECTSRGKVAAKNKGNLQMYFVDRIKKEYAKDANGRQPNEKLMTIITDLR